MEEEKIEQVQPDTISKAEYEKLEQSYESLKRETETLKTTLADVREELNRQVEKESEKTPKRSIRELILSSFQTKEDDR